MVIDHRRLPPHCSLPGEHGSVNELVMRLATAIIDAGIQELLIPKSGPRTIEFERY